MNLAKIKIWVLVPMLDTVDPNLAYYSDYGLSFAEYDKAFKTLNLPWHWQPVRTHDFKQIIDSIANEPSNFTPVVFNLCDGDDVNGIPGISVLYYLEEKNLIYTGSNPFFYDITTSKIVMKKAFDKAHIPTPAWEVLELDGSNISGIFDRLGKPLILKPAISAGSMGITIKSVVETEGALQEQLDLMNQGYRGWELTNGGLLVESFVNGFEFTTFIIGNANDEKNALIYLPIERVFNKKLPEKEQFLSFDRLWEFYEEEEGFGENEYLWEYDRIPKEYEAEVRRISWDAYQSVNGDGYGRVDLRMDRMTKQLYVLEVNAQCGIAADENHSSIGAILRYEEQPFSNIVKEIIDYALKKKALTMVKPLKICVLQPDYSTSAIDYQLYDPPRDLSSLMPEAHFDHVFLNKLTTYRQLKLLSKKGYDVFVNLCDGYIEWEVPTIESFQFLELFNLPFTGSTSVFYDLPKEVMKYVAYTEGVRTPNYALIESLEDIEETCKQLTFPLFVKPAHAGDSLGIDAASLVRNKEDLTSKVAATIADYTELLVEEYIDGREFTVLVAASADGTTRTFQPVEFIFPEGSKFKTYSMKTSELHPKANVPVTDPDLNQRLREAGKRIFKASNSAGYGRLDFRMNAAGELFFLEINFTCSVFYSDGYEGSADYILQHDGIGQTGFLKHIIEEGIERHKHKQKKYVVKGNAINGYGIYAVKDLPKGDVIFKGEGKTQRIITQNYVKKHWSAEEQDTFSRYAYPLSSEVFILWGEKPEDWAPHNHSCEPNTGYEGLDCVALHAIKSGEELTFDYADLYNEVMKPFTCHCGAPTCRGEIHGTLNNSVETREKLFPH